ncbi:unnamed protein product [Urochloa decumbens]|uniref:Uncharacterized protein n=1 Tax=Urochloa decumbens TaxID=240449 RepID=A0ABC9F7I8_9POAL
MHQHVHPPESHMRISTVVINNRMQGYGMLTVSAAVQQQQQHQQGLVYASLYLIAVAQGADKPCGLAFAADQFDAEHPGERASRGSLFNWWFFCMAVGISVAVAVVGYIQEAVSWGVGFGVPCAIVLAAFIVFLIGTPTYRLSAATAASSYWHLQKHKQQQMMQQPSSSPFVRLARGLRAVLLPGGQHDDEQQEDQHQHQQQQAEEFEQDARCVLRLLPIWVSSLAYGVVYAQIMTLFNKQGRTLDRRTIFNKQLPPAALQALGPLSILLFVPVYDRALVPALRRATGNPSGLTMLQRVGAGMATSLAAVSVAALVEARRLAAAREHGLVDRPEATVPMSWAWLLPQYAMMGVADVLAVVGLQELFYDQMPAGLRSLGLALYLSVMGLGGLISSVLISLIDASGMGWFDDNLNRAHLDYFYWLLAAISAVELALYLAFARSYVYRRHKHPATY